MNWLFFAVFLCCAATGPRATAAGVPDGSVAWTPRQREIMRELDTYRPPWGGKPGEGPWLLGNWDADAGLAELVTVPTGGGDAAACFKRMETFYPEEKSTLESGGEDSRGVMELLAAADMGECRLTPDIYPEIETSEARGMDVEVMRDYLQALLRRADLRLRDGRLDEAERCYRAALLCGKHLTGDKATGLVYVTGLIFTMRGAQGYAAFLLRKGDTGKADTARRLAARMGELMRAFSWKATTALGDMDGFGCLGAAIRIAREDAEPFWRREAVMRLGALRYGVVRDGTVERNPVFEALADRTLEDVVARDKDDWVRRLAIWTALNVTPGGYGDMDHRFSTR